MVIFKSDLSCSNDFVLKTRGLMRQLDPRGCTDGCELLPGCQCVTDTETEQEAEVVGKHDDQEQPN